ncbi:hypothetical protein FOZ63_008180, partial [Perkinsus olseni]
EEEYGIVLIVIDDDGCVWMRTDDRPACGRRVWFPSLPFTRGVEAGDRCQQVLQLYNGFTHRGDEYGFATATRSGGVVVIEGCVGNTREFPDISTRQAALPLQVAALPIGFRPATVMSFLTASDIIVATFMHRRQQHIRCLAIALQYLLVFPLSLFPPPVDQLVSTLRKRILVRRSDLDWPAVAVTPRPDVCDSSLQGPTCSIIDGPQSGLAVLHHGGVRLGELLPESLLDSSDDADELRAR